MDGFIDIIGYEGDYMINKEGDVYGCVKKKCLKPRLDKDGYYTVGLRKGREQKHLKIHRLIAIHFIPNPENLPIIDHIDICKTNNNIENLRWVSHLTNENNKIKQKNNTSGFKNIHNDNKNWRICIIYNFVVYRKSYNKNKYTLEEVVAFRNEKYLELGLKIFD
jgi:hypothetical protein